MAKESTVTKLQSDDAPVRASRLNLDDRYRLSKYLHLRPYEQGFAVESLVSGKRQALPNLASVRILLSFTTPVRLRSVLDSASERSAPLLLKFIERCIDDALLTRIEPDDSAAEDAIAALRGWEAHDLTFHMRSRRGRNPNPLGMTWHLANVVPPEPAHRPSRASDLGVVKLEVPDLHQLRDTDMSLTRALESRRSRYTTHPVPLRLLGELLYRALHVSETLEVGGEELIRKVYPSGGSRHSLEVYVAVNRCTGLENGGYRYDALNHRLERVTPPTLDLQPLLREAQVGTGSLQDLPSVLLIFASRIRRVTRKYQSNAYRVVLQELGGLYQTIYLIAESLGLCVSAIGGGDSARFSAAFDTDFFGEPSVGEMIIGGRESLI